MDRSRHTSRLAARSLALVVMLAVSPVLLFAQGDESGKAADPSVLRARQFRRDLELLELFVTSAVQLSGENDPLACAERCRTLAERLSKEIQKSTKASEPLRTTELGHMLQAVLVKGISTNLKRMETKPAPEQRSEEVLKISDSVLTFTQPVEEAMQQLPIKELEKVKPALQGLSKAREEIQKSSSGKWQKGPPPGKGKKGKKT